MSRDETPDYYEILQISPTAEPETVHKVYRLLAQRCHPDNKDTGNEAQFRQLSDAYQVLSDPERRAQYDVAPCGAAAVPLAAGVQRRAGRERLRGRTADPPDRARGALHAPPDRAGHSGVSPWDLEQLIGRAREQLEFTIWYLAQKKYVTRSDSAALVITAEGVEFLEANYAMSSQRRLPQGQKAS